MTLEDAKRVIYGNVIWACEKADFSPFTIDMVQDACETVIALAEKADTLQTEQSHCNGCKHYTDGMISETICNDCRRSYTDNYEPQTDCLRK